MGVYGASWDPFQGFWDKGASTRGAEICSVLHNIRLHHALLCVLLHQLHAECVAAEIAHWLPQRGIQEELAHDAALQGGRVAPQVTHELLSDQRQILAKHVDVQVVPVFADGHAEGEGAQADHAGAAAVVHHPVDVFLQQDGQVAGRGLEGLPVLNNGGIGQHVTDGTWAEEELAYLRGVQTNWGTGRGCSICHRDAHVGTQLSQAQLEVLCSKAN